MRGYYLLVITILIGSSFAFPIITPNTASIHAMADTNSLSDAASPAQATNWLAEWTYRKAITITGVEDAGTNYQIKLILHYGSGTDSGNNIYLLSHCQEDFGDVRFTSNDGLTQLDYWIASKTDSNDAVFWVEVLNNLDSDQVIYVYYGNNAFQTTTSNGRNTFLWFYDFENDVVGADPSTTYWDPPVDDDGIRIINDPDRDGKCLEVHNDGADDAETYVQTKSLGLPGGLPGVAVNMLVQRVTDEYTYDNVQGTSGNVLIHGVWKYSTGYNDPQFYDGTDYKQPTPDWTEGTSFTWQNWEFKFHDGSTAILEDYTSGSTHTISLATTYDRNTNYVDAIRPMYSNRWRKHSAYVDDIFVRKWVYASQGEPAVSSVGEEENINIHNSPWLYGWKYRICINIDGATGAGTNYQIMLKVHYGTGTNTGNNVFAASHCQADFGDIRFVDDDGQTLLNYWMQEKVDSDSAVFWIKVTDDLSSDQKIYLYYGTNIETATTSSGQSTFLFFDDFNDGVLDTTKWDHVGSPDGTENNGQYDQPQDNSYNQGIGTDQRWLYASGYAVGARLYSDWPTSGYGMTWGLALDDAANNNEDTYTNGLHNFIGFRRDADGSQKIAHTIHASTPTVDAFTWAGSYHNFETKVTSTFISLSYDGTTLESGTGATDTQFRITLIGNGPADVHGKVDWVYLRNFVTNEPSISSFGNEEYNGDYGGSYNPALLYQIAGFSLFGLGICIIVVAVLVFRKYSEKIHLTFDRSSKAEERKEPQSLLESPGERITDHVPREISPQSPQMDAIVQDVIATRRVPRVFEKIMTKSTSNDPIQVKSGFDVVGEYLKLAVKVENTSDLIITDVQVILNVPDGFEFARDTSQMQKLGNIAGHSFQSAIFWLRPLRCVDSEYGGTVLYVDAHGTQQVVKIPTKRLVNICPMLTATERADEVFSRLKSGALARNCSSFEFSGNARAVLKMAEARLSGLTPVDHSEHEYEDGMYLGYACYVGQTKYGESQFAAEIQVSGTPQGGVLTVSIYSDDERILSGFFVDIMYDIRQHIEIIKEKMCPLATCSKCGAPIDLTKVGPDRIYRCEYCGTMGKASPWLD
ncbi:MAG: DUF2341 domain-containing protein [Candidatus Thorarchaeota archaeon]|nr:DUF2341 domain-containing protein [Candidatus Thorarchaeota archaeon]